VTPSHSKVFINTLEKIREIIQNDGLVAGDKIPSERELADRLSVGRSSVREALRALELLGIIETRRGEGTYIKDVREHQLIPLLGTFIMQDTKAKEDILEMNEMLEKNALMLIINKRDKSALFEMRNQIKEYDRFSIMDQFMMLSDNYLLYRIWSVLHQYTKTLFPKSSDLKQDQIEKLLNCLLEEDEEGVLEAYRHLFTNSF